MKINKQRHERINPLLCKMQITWILPFTLKTGGIQVVFEYANRLQQRGHTVNLVVPMLAFSNFTGSFFQRVLARLRMCLGNTLRRGRKVHWFNLEVPVLLVPWISDRFLPKSDVVIATAWPTAHAVARLGAKCGVKYYFVQHHENWSGDLRDVENSYKLPLRLLVIASWLRDLMEKKYERKVHALVPNAVDRTCFHANEKAWPHPPVLLMQYHEWPWKGFADGLAVFARVQQEFPDIRLRLFGMHKGSDIPDHAEFFYNPDKNTLRKLYATSTIFLFPSWSEGWGLPVLEAMACRTAVVATRVGCLFDVGTPGLTAMVASPRDIEGLASGVLELLRDKVLLQKIGDAGWGLMENYDWDKSTETLLHALQDG